MRKYNRIWVRNDSVYKWHVAKVYNLALCGTSLETLFREKIEEDRMPEQEACKICWKITGK